MREVSALQGYCYLKRRRRYLSSDIKNVIQFTITGTKDRTTVQNVRSNITRRFNLQLHLQKGCAKKKRNSYWPANKEEFEEYGKLFCNSMCHRNRMRLMVHSHCPRTIPIASTQNPMAIWVVICLQSMNTFTQSYTNHFYRSRYRRV